MQTSGIRCCHNFSHSICPMFFDVHMRSELSLLSLCLKHAARCGIQELTVDHWKLIVSYEPRKWDPSWNDELRFVEKYGLHETKYFASESVGRWNCAVN